MLPKYQFINYRKKVSEIRMSATDECTIMTWHLTKCSYLFKLKLHYFSF